MVGKCSKTRAFEAIEPRFEESRGGVLWIYIPKTVASTEVVFLFAKIIEGGKRLVKETKVFRKVLDDLGIRRYRNWKDRLESQFRAQLRSAQ